MKDEIGPLLVRTALDEVETQHNAVGRLVNILRGRSTGRDKDASLADARDALYGLLASPRPGVASKACQGLSQLALVEQSQAESETIVGGEEAIDRIVKALQTAVARGEQQEHHQLEQPGSHHRQRRQGAGVTQALAKCLVDVIRARARREESRERHSFITTLLAMNRGLLFPALSHEATCFLGRADVDPKGVVCVLSPLTAAVMLQPEYANLRGIFLLKISAASATASDAIKLCLIVLQAELLSFCAVHTEAHADIAASWCSALANCSISLESEASWKRASRAVTAVAISLVAEFRERGFSITPLLAPLRSIAAAGAESLAREVAFLGITALQTPCVDERVGLLNVIGHTVEPMSLADVLDVREQAWSLETLVYPVVSMAAAGNTAATEVLPPLEAALSGVSRRLIDAKLGEGGTPAPDRTKNNGVDSGGESGKNVKLLRHRTDVALAVRRLCALEDEPALVRSCEGLRRRAEEHVRLSRESRDGGGGRRIEATSSPDLLELESAFCLLSPAILRPHLKHAHGAACAALVSVVRAAPTLGVRLLPFVLYAIKRVTGRVELDEGGGGALLPLLQLLPELGAHKVAAKQVTATLISLVRAHQVVVRGLGLRLAARLIQINSRTFDQLQPLFVKTPEDHVPPYPPEPEESRMCRAAGMLDVCTNEPELGLECVRPLQALLADPSAPVVALALRAIAALIRADCLDFDVALRIVTKKGKVAHTGRDAEKGLGDPLVVEGLAKLCGSGAEAAASASAAESSGDSEEDLDGGRGCQWGMSKAVEILLERNVGRHPDEAVRRAVYGALAAHLPALLRAETGQEADEDAVVLAPLVRTFLGKAISADLSLLARSSLQDAVKIVLIAESVDPSTWRTSSGRAERARGARSDRGKQQSGPSNRLLAALPQPEVVLEAFVRGDFSCSGLAGAALWSYPARAAEMAAARRDAMARDLVDIMPAEGTRAGLAPCPWQKAVTPMGIQRFVRRLFAACLAAESGGAGNGLSPDVVTAVNACRSVIRDIRGVPQGIVEVAVASLATCVPTSSAHVMVEEAHRAIRRLRDGGVGGAYTVLEGEELFSLAAAMVARALPAETARLQAEAADALEAIVSVNDNEAGATAEALMVDDDILARGGTTASFWSWVSVGVVSEWSIRHPTAPEARRAVSRGARRLLAGLATAVGSNHVASIADALFCRNEVSANGEDRVPEMVEWDSIDLGSIQLLRGERSDLGLPTTARGSRCLALFLGLCSIPAGLRATGLHKELLQVFHIVRAFQEAGVCGAALCLSPAASECLTCGLIDVPMILDCLRSLSVALDGATLALSSGERESTSQDVFIGAAVLVASVHGRVILPPGFTESMFERLRNAAAHRSCVDSGVRVASLLGLASMVGCPLLGVGEYVPRCTRVSPFVTRRMVEHLLQIVHETMEGASLRPKDAAARVWGCLAALGEDECSVEDRALRDALGWTEGGASLASNPGGFINPYALSVAREDTLMATVLNGLQAVAGGKKGTRTVNEREEKPDTVAAIPWHPSLFAASAMACLEEASSTLRVPHAQMAVVLGVIFRGGHEANVEMRCISLALALVSKHQAYSAWLRGLYRRSLLANLLPKTFRYLVAVFDRFASKEPPETVVGLMKDIWDTLAPTLFARAILDGPGSTRAAPAGDDEIASQAAEFLSGLGRLAGGTSPALGVATEAVTLGIILPSVMDAFAIRGSPASLLLGGPMWDGLVELLARLPPESVRLAISFKPKPSSSPSPISSAAQESIQAYLVSRLAASEGLSAVVRWATDVRTGREASATVLPHLAEGLARVDIASSRDAWFRTLLDTAGLPEVSPTRAAALLGGAAVAWDSSVVSGSLVVGERADGLFGLEAVGGGDYRRGSLLYALSVAAPRVVAEIENSSPGVSREILTRLIRVSGLLRSGNRSGDDGATITDRVDEQGELQLGFEGFVRGLRHASPILSGTLSRQFAAYAESIAEEEASSLHASTTGVDKY